MIVQFWKQWTTIGNRLTATVSSSSSSSLFSHHCLAQKIRCASSSFGAVNVFDRNAKRRQKDRASMAEDPALYDYLKDAIAGQIVDRIYDVSRFIILRYLDVHV